ncbi:unnamed protein product, partial [marine sediment metagenome]
MPFFAADSIGSPVALADGDSVFLTIYYPSGTVAFLDTLAYNGAAITVSTFSGWTVYNWKAAIADIDGTPVEGTYSYWIIVDDNTGAALGTPSKGTFQLYTTADFDATLDENAAILDSLQRFTKAATDSLQAILDSLQATLDVNVVSVAADAIEAGDFKTAAIDADAIAANAIGSSELAAGAISYAEITADAIGASELAADAVTEIVTAMWNYVLVDTG